MPSIDDVTKKREIHERKIEGTLTEVEIDPEFLEFAGFKKCKKCD